MSTKILLNRVMNSIYSNSRNKTTHFTVRDLIAIERSIRSFKKDISPMTSMKTDTMSHHNFSKKVVNKLDRNRK